MATVKDLINELGGLDGRLAVKVGIPADYPLMLEVTGVRWVDGEAVIATADPGDG